MNTKKFNKSVFMFLLVTPIIYFLISPIVKSCLVDFFISQNSDVKTIKKLINSKDTEYIKYDTLDRCGHRFYFVLESDPNTSSDQILEESLILFQDILDTTKNNDLRFFSSNIEFYVGYKTSNKFTTAFVLQNYTVLNRNDSEFDNKIKLIKVYNLKSIRSLKMKRESIEYICCYRTSDLLLPDFTEFKNLNILTFDKCKNSDGTDVFSYFDIIRLKKYLPDVDVKISR